MAAQLFAVFLFLLAFAATASGFVIEQYALCFWILAGLFGVAAVGVWLWESRRKKHSDGGVSREQFAQLLALLKESGAIPVSTEARGEQIVRAVGDAVEIRDEVTATVTRATAGSGDVIVTPLTARLFVGEVARVALAGHASGKGQAFDATVEIQESISRPEEPQSPESSKHD